VESVASQFPYVCHDAGVVRALHRRAWFVAEKHECPIGGSQTLTQEFQEHLSHSSHVEGIQAARIKADSHRERAVEGLERARFGLVEEYMHQWLEGKECSSRAGAASRY
jgi:hypothetical protein